MKHVHAAARWIAETSARSESPSGSGVVCAWGLGHQVRYYSRHGVIQDNFGPYVARENVDLASRYYETDSESEGLGILEDLHVRWGVVDRSGAGLLGRPYPASRLTARMSGHRGSTIRLDGSSSSSEVAPALERHRLVYETPGERRAVRVFEIVAGARFEGRAEPGSIIRVRLPLKSEVSRFEYRARVEADESGRYLLRLPYSTEDVDAYVTPRGPYRIRLGEQEFRLSVPERAVRDGSLLAPGELRPHAAADVHFSP